MLSKEFQVILASIADIVTACGLILGLIGLFIAYRTHRMERESEILEREYGTFDALDDKYVEFMYKCAEHPHLDLFSIPIDSPRKLSTDDLNRERALYSVLISIFERAFLMFEKRASKELKERQYPGWKETMRTYCLRESFLHEWTQIGIQFDREFQVEMNGLISEEKSKLNLSEQQNMA